MGEEEKKKEEEEEEEGERGRERERVSVGGCALCTRLHRLFSPSAKCLHRVVVILVFFVIAPYWSHLLLLLF